MVSFTVSDHARLAMSALLLLELRVGFAEKMFSVPSDCQLAR